MTAKQRTLLTTLAFLSLSTAILSYCLSKSIDSFSYALRVALIVFIVCIVLLKE